MRAIPLLVVLITAFPARGQEPAVRILFVGNSLTFWNEGLYFHIERLAASDTPPVAIATGRSVVPGPF